MLSTAAQAHGQRVMMTAMTSPAAAAKARERRSVRVFTYADDGVDEDWSQQKKKPRKTSVPTGAIVSRGGMATKTGFVLARAQLAARSSTGVVAAQERHTALVGKGKYREEEKVAQEQPVGHLATNDMPRRKDWKGTSEQFKHGFNQWLRTKVPVKVRRSAALRIASCLVRACMPEAVFTAWLGVCVRGR